MSRPRPAVVLALAALACLLGAAGFLGARALGEGAREPEAAALGEAPRGVGAAAPKTGGLDLELPAGFLPVPLPSAGFGLGVPAGWQAVVLTDDAIGRVEELGFAGGFVNAARRAQASGALLYAAGVQPDGSVSDLKVMVPVPREGPPGARDVEELARAALAAAPPGSSLELLVQEGPPRARLRFDAGAGAIEASGTQWVVAGPDAVWSLIITSEDPATHDALARSIADTLTFPTRG